MTRHAAPRGRVPASFWCALAACGLLQLGCTSPPIPESNRTAFLDPHMAQRASGEAVIVFDGKPSALVLGEGWFAPDETTSGHGPRFAVASDEASLYAPYPGDGEWELVSRCRRSRGVHEGILLSLNGHTLPAVRFPMKYGLVRVKLPARHLRHGTNLLEFHAERPDDQAAASPDRPLGAFACRRIGVGRPGTTLATLVRTRPRTDPAASRILVAPSAGLALPLPATAGGALGLGRIDGLRDAGVLSISHRTGVGDGTLLWRGPVVDAVGRSVDIPAFPRPSQLVVEIDTPTPTKGNPVQRCVIEVASLRLAPPTEPETRPDVFVYVVDTLRADALGAYGSASHASPRFDAFARSAVLFEKAWSAAPWTLPAVASLLTGTPAREHGAVGLDSPGALKSETATLAQALHTSGYDTLGISQSLVVSPRFGMDRGFETFYTNNLLGWRTHESGAVRRLLWDYLLHRDSDRPLFAYLHTMEPHSPYSPAGVDRELSRGPGGHLAEADYLPHEFGRAGHGQRSEELAYLRGLYDGEVKSADREFGAFLDQIAFLGRYDSSFVVFTSDHGEEFFEHGGFDHARTVFEELLWVPFAIRYPRGENGGRGIAQRVSTIDTGATIADLVGVDEQAAAVPGQSLAPAIAGIPTEGPLFAETIAPKRDGYYEPVELSASVVGDIKCVYNPLGRNRFGQQERVEQVFDLSQDRSELEPISVDDPRSERCLRALREFVAKGPSTSERETAEASHALDAQTKKKLQALGYLE